MKLTRSCLAASLLIGVMLSVPAIGMEKFRKLTDQQIRARLAGMEITDEVHWSEIYNRDGTLTIWSMAKKRVGKWRVDKGQLCLNIEKREPDCKEVWISGNKVEFRYPGVSMPTEGVLTKQLPRS